MYKCNHFVHIVKRNYKAPTLYTTLRVETINNAGR